MRRAVFALAQLQPQGASHSPKMPIAAAIGTLCWPRKSDIASPIPVVRSFSPQKITVISGTFVKATRAREVSRSGIATHQQICGEREQGERVSTVHGEPDPR